MMKQSGKYRFGNSGWINIRRKRIFGQRHPAVMIIACLLMLSCLVGIAPMTSALPEGGYVVDGDGQIDADGDTLTVWQESDWLGIDWHRFSIGQDELVLFVQPGADSVALNRVLGPDPSEILGRLEANGQVFLINPQGVLFGEGARVDAGGIVASALDWNAAEFDGSNYTFFRNDTNTSEGEQSSGGSLAGTVVNLGEIGASEGGYVAFIGTKIENAGWVMAPLGTIAVGAGERVTMALDERSLVSFSVDEAALGAIIENSGVLTADGGVVVLDVQAQDAFQDTVLNLEGIVRARGLQSQGGVITLSGGDQGVVDITGSVDASGRDESGPTGLGGQIQITGEYISLDGDAWIDASGAIGGDIVIGGDYQGANPDVQNARAVFVDEHVVIDASALDGSEVQFGIDGTTPVEPVSGTKAAGEHDLGDGGRVILWSDEMMRFLGHIRARGAESGGDGGFVEVSGRDYLDFHGIADVRAPRGTIGSLLLDPQNIVISTGNDARGSWSGGGDRFYNPSGTLYAVLNVNTLLNQLALGNVMISTTSPENEPGAITIATPINYTGAEARSLTLWADANIAMQHSITSTNAPLDVTLRASQRRGIQVQPGTSIVTLGGNIILDQTSHEGSTDVGNYGIWIMNNTLLDSGGGNISITGTHLDGGSRSEAIRVFMDASIRSGGGDITLHGIGGPTGIDIQQGAEINSGSGDLKLEATNIRFGGRSALQSEGTLTFNITDTSEIDARDAIIHANDLVLIGPTSNFIIGNTESVINALRSARAINIGIAFGNELQPSAIGGTLPSDTIEVHAITVHAGRGGLSIVGPITADVVQVLTEGTVTQQEAARLDVGLLELDALGQTVTLGSLNNMIHEVSGAVGQLTLGFSGDMNVGELIAGGNVSFTSTSAGAFTQSDRVSAFGLVLDAPNMDVMLNDVNNNFTQLAANVKSLKLTNASDELTIGTLNGIQGVRTQSTFVLTQHGGTVSQQSDAAIVLEGPSRLGLVGHATFNLPSFDNQITHLAADVDRLTLGFGGIQLRIADVPDALDGAGSLIGITADELTLYAPDHALGVYQDEVINVGELNLIGPHSEFSFIRTDNRVSTLGHVKAQDLRLILGSGHIHISGDVNVGADFYMSTGGDITQSDDAAIKTNTLILNASDGPANFELTSMRNEIRKLAADVTLDGVLSVNNATDLTIDNQRSVSGIWAATFTLGLSGRHTVTQTDNAFVWVGELNLDGPNTDFVFTNDRVSINRLRSATARNLSLNLSDTILGGQGFGESMNIAQDLLILNHTNWVETEGDITVGGTLTFDGRYIRQGERTAIKADQMLIRGKGETYHFNLGSRQNEIGRLAVENVHTFSLGFTGDLTIGTISGVEGITLNPGMSTSKLTFLTDDGTLSPDARIVTNRLHIDAPHMDLVLNRYDNEIGQLVSARVKSLDIEQSGSWVLGGFSQHDVISVVEGLHARAVGTDADLTINQTIEYRGDTAGQMIFEADRSVNVSMANMGVKEDALGYADVVINADRQAQGEGNVRVYQSKINTSGGLIAMGGGTWDLGTRTFSAPASGFGTANDQTTGIYLMTSNINSGSGSIHLYGRGSVGVLADGSAIDSTSGHINIDGVGLGSSAGYGVRLRHSSITSSTGNIHLTGEAQDAGSGNHGISISARAVDAFASDTGEMTLIGRSGAASSGIEVLGRIGHAHATGDIHILAGNENGASTVYFFQGDSFLESQGDLYVAPIDPSHTMGITAGAGQFRILSALGSGFNRIVLGHESGTGKVTFGSHHTFDTDVVLRGDDIDITHDMNVGGNRLTLRSGGTVHATGRLIARELLLDGGIQGAFYLNTRNDIDTLAAHARVVDVSLRGETTVAAIGGMTGVTATESATFSTADVTGLSYVFGTLRQSDDSAIVTPLLTLKGVPSGAEGQGDFRLLNGKNKVETLRIDHAKKVDFGNLGTIHIGTSDFRNWALVHAQGDDADVIVTGDLRSFRPHNRLVLRADRSVIVDEDVTIGHGGDGHTLMLVLNADADENKHGNIQMLRGANIALKSGNVHMGGGAYDQDSYGNPLSDVAYGIGDERAAHEAGIYMEDAFVTLENSGSVLMMGEAYADGFGVDLVSSEILANGGFSGSITIAAGNDGTGDSIDLTGSTILGDSILYLRPTDPGATIGIAGGEGAFNLSYDDLAGLGHNFRRVEIGSSRGTGDIVFGDGGEIGYSFVPSSVSMVTDTGSIYIDSPLSADQLTIISNRAMMQRINGALAVDELNLLSFDPVTYELGLGTFTLDADGNQVETLHAAGGSLSYRGRGDLVIMGMEMDGHAEVVVDGDITIDAEALWDEMIFAGGEGDAIVLVAGGDFHVTETSGATPFETPNGRYLIYSTNPNDNTFGRFASPGNLFGFNYDDNGPSTIDEALGSRMIYSYRPTLIVRADAIHDVIYGEAIDPAAFSWTPVSGLVDGDAWEDVVVGALTTAMTGKEDAGTYTGAITAGTLETRLGYLLDFRPGDLTINARPIIIGAEDRTKVYGHEWNSSHLGWTLIDGRVVDGDEIEVVLASDGLDSKASVIRDEAGELVGYIITAETLNHNNYDITFEEGTLFVTPATLTITGDDLQRVYGDTNPELTWGYEGLAAWDDLTDVIQVISSTTATDQSDVGTYVISVSGETQTNNYIAIFEDGMMQITPARLVVTVNDESRPYGTDNPEFTVAYHGFKLDHDETIFEDDWFFHTSAEMDSLPGEYEVVAEGGLIHDPLSGNYELVFEPGVLTIIPSGYQEPPGVPHGAYNDILGSIFRWLRWEAERSTVTPGSLVTIKVFEGE